MDHVIEGNLQDGANIDVGKEKLAVHAFVKGKEVAKADIDTLGRFKVTFASDEERPLTELRVTPAKPTEGTPIVAASEKLESAQFSVAGNVATAQSNIRVSREMLEIIRIYSLQYEMFGRVYHDYPTVSTVPGLKMDFYEFDWRVILPPPIFPKRQAGRFGELGNPAIRNLILKLGPQLLPEESYLGTTYTGPDGQYDFKFFWRIFPPNMDSQPDILVRISQFSGSEWNEVFCGPVDWNIILKFNRDFVVPTASLLPVPALNTTSDFLFASIGLIPVDEVHLVKGCANTDANDPIEIANMQNRPFGETLSIGGFFPQGSQVASYKVEIAKTTEDYKSGGNVLTWNEVLDPLHNSKWNPTTRLWDHKVLGPDPKTHRFTNVDNERDWLEPALKFTFNSATQDDGFYVFRITGFDGAGKQVGRVIESPVLCFDNTAPEAALDVLHVGVCGGAELKQAVDDAGKPIHTLDLQVTAYDKAAHVQSATISATRGKIPISGDLVFSPRPVVPSVPGNGAIDAPITVTVTDVPPELSGCATLAYSVYLEVCGASTNGRSRMLGSQYVWKVVNLTVKKP